jgi:single-strand DNA-binding protein
VDRRFSKQGEEKQADFFPIVAWDKQAEFCSKYFTKGLKVVVIGRLQTRTWDDNEGKRHYVTEVVAEELHFAESKKSQEFNEPRLAEPTTEPSDGFYPIDDDDQLPF